MDFKDIISFKDSINQLKIITLVVVICCFSLVGFMYYLNTSQQASFLRDIEESKNKMFVLNPETGRLLGGEYRLKNIEDRSLIYKGLVRDFYESVYDFDGHSIRTNLEHGLGLCTSDVGEVIANTYFNTEKDMEREMLAEKTAHYIRVDSIILDKNDPKHGVAFAHHLIVKPYGRAMSKLNTEFFIKDIDNISDKNLYGAVIKKWIITNNDIIKE